MSTAIDHDVRRIAFIDHMKAIGIVLVVVGHAPAIPDRIVELIYSFHIPLFFFISGYLMSVRRLREPLRRVFTRTLHDLGLPYLVFFAISYAYWLATFRIGPRAGKFASVQWYEPLFGLVSGRGGDLIINPTLWYFPCLIVTAIAYVLVRRVATARTAWLLFLGTALAATLLAGPARVRWPWATDGMAVSLFFMACGECLRALEPKLERIAKPLAAIAALLATAAWIMLSGANGRVDLNMMQFGVLPWLYLPVALLGIAMCLAIAKAVPPHAALQWLAVHSMILFPTHPLVFNFLSGLGSLVLKLPTGGTHTLGWALISMAASIACVPLFERALRPVLRRQPR